MDKINCKIKPEEEEAVLAADSEFKERIEYQQKIKKIFGRGIL